MRGVTRPEPALDAAVLEDGSDARGNRCSYTRRVSHRRMATHTARLVHRPDAEE